jgi:exopolysaccharide biosynthesis polyprenyl glycosylphosphotransferase
MNRLVRFFLYKPIVVAVDVLLVDAGFLLAYLLGNGYLPAPLQRDSVLPLSVLFSLSTLIIFHLLDLYRDWLRRSLRHVLYSVIIAVVIMLLTTMGLAFWSRPLAVPRGLLLLAACFQVTLLCAYRIFMRRIYRHSFGNRRTVIVGETDEDAASIMRKFEAHDVGLYHVEGYRLRRDLMPPYRELDDAETVVLSQGLEQKEDLILHCFRCHKELLVVPNLPELTLFGAEPREIDDLLIFGIKPHSLNPAEEFLKRGFDVVAASLLLLLTSPLLIVVAIAIRMSSPGPVLFHQKRVGRGRRAFDVLKFRTMVIDAERYSGPVLASEDDPRITGVGRLLRARRVDELPQLFNVIRGEMSLIGPRPERPYFVEQFERDFPAYELRHAVKPGITGLAQVMGRYGTTPESKLHFDLLYIYNYSLLLDLKLLLQTIRVVLQGEEAVDLKIRAVPLTRLVQRIESIEEMAESGSSQAD